MSSRYFHLSEHNRGLTAQMIVPIRSATPYFTFSIVADSYQRLNLPQESTREYKLLRLSKNSVRESIVHSYTFTTHKNTLHRQQTSHGQTIGTLSIFLPGFLEAWTKLYPSLYMSNLHTCLGKRPTPTTN